MDLALAHLKPKIMVQLLDRPRASKLLTEAMPLMASKALEPVAEATEPVPEATEPVAEAAHLSPVAEVPVAEATHL